MTQVGTLGPRQLWLMVRSSEHRHRGADSAQLGERGLIGASVDSGPADGTGRRIPCSR